MRTFPLLSQLVIILLVAVVTSCHKVYNDDYKDFQIAIVGTDYAKVSILKYSDSTFVTSAIYDSQNDSNLHFSNIAGGKYIISAYCSYSSLKANEVTQVVQYSGKYGSYTLYFDKR